MKEKANIEIVEGGTMPAKAHATGSCEGLPNSTDGLAALKRLVTHPSCGIVLPLSP